jgi:hypothetical protein
VLAELFLSMWFQQHNIELRLRWRRYLVDIIIWMNTEFFICGVLVLPCFVSQHLPTKFRSYSIWRFKEALCESIPYVYKNLQEQVSNMIDLPIEVLLLSIRNRHKCRDNLNTSKTSSEELTANYIDTSVILLGEENNI